MHKATDTSQKVMDRIMNENKWAMPAHQKEPNISKRLNKISLIISILLLVGISVSFIYISPNATTKIKIEAPQQENVVTTIRSTDFAKTFANLDFVGMQDGMVAGIGEPKIYQPESYNNNQSILMLTILGISMVTLFLSWLSSGKDSNHT